MKHSTLWSAPVNDPQHPGFQFQDSYLARQVNAKLYQFNTDSLGNAWYAQPRLRKERTESEYSFTHRTPRLLAAMEMPTILSATIRWKKAAL